MRILRPSDLFRRMAVYGPVGFGEAYLAGDWTSSDPAGILTPFAARLTKPVNRPMAAFRRWADRERPADERNTIEGARTNVERHYDLPTEFFALFLDDSMTYSSALFSSTDDLHAAQIRKVDAILDHAGVGPGIQLIEIGSGWGTLAVRAARRGADVTTLTISREQQRSTQRRIDEAGVGDRARVQLLDYRAATGDYDAVVSVEMIEAVGADYWPTYFAILDRLLKPGGRIALQAITMPHDRMLALKDVHTWIQKYIFPGGQLPSVEAIEEQVRGRSGLRITARRRLGDDYARTLRLWRDRLLANDDRATALGFDATFRRVWEFYLAYSEAGFRAHYLDVWQFRLDKS
jgi:cyclopropane-fatty-acyl-phospholipid synthase